MSPVQDLATAPPEPRNQAQPAEDEIVGYTRSPSDVLRVAPFALVSLALLAITRWAEDGVLGVERDLLALLGFVNPSVARLLAGATGILVVVVAFGVFVPPILLKRYRLLGYTAAGNVAAAAFTSAATWWLDRAEPAQITNAIAERAGVDLDSTLTAVVLAQITASFVILAPFVSARWRRAGMVLLGVLTLLRLLLASHLPAELALSLVLGALVGSAVLLAFGRPDHRPTLAAVSEALRRSGLPVAHLQPASVDARGSTPYLATLEDGSRVFAKALSPDERSADLLFRAYRFLRLKNVGDERPFSSLRRTVEHEALVSLQARDVGVHTPRLRAIATVGTDSMLLSYDLIDGSSMDGLEPDEVDDDLLRGLWEQVGVLRRHRIAHRDLRRANVFVAADGAPWLIDFGFSEVAASDQLLAADVAQLLAALSIIAGADRAVDTAVQVLGTEAVATAVPYLQPNALSGATRTALGQHKGLLDELRVCAVDRSGIDEPEYVALDRVNAKTILVLAMLAGATYFLFPQLADLPGIVDQVQEADWAWFPAVLAMSALTYVGATVSLTGAVPDRLRMLPTAATQVGSSFASKLAPAAAGGIALNVRYLQKAGVDSAVAVSGVGLNSVAGFVTHVVLLLAFVIWAGRSAFDAIDLPDPTVFLYGIAAVAVIAAVALAFPAVRAQLRTRLVPVVRRSLGGVAEVLRRPGKLALLLGGSAVVTLSYILASYLSLRAFGGDLSVAEVGAIYLAGSAVASAAPTPGGLGALEAALIAGYVAAGVDNTIAVPAVFLYRFATFWIPILPGWLCFTWLQRRSYI